ncbi:MAG: hypothetical protein LBT89_00980 [Planctomycetaceae bacterium]|jgi:adenosylhomocysteine nucleosidase|nr:hypothetical protein [Planctomycetaceae bacterium]
MSQLDNTIPCPDAGFVFALPIEGAGIIERLTQRRTTKGNGRTFHSGRFANRRIVLIESGIGQEAARAAAEVLCDVFNPKCLCSAGYAGGLSQRLKKMTLCIPQQVVRLSDGAALDLTGSVPQRLDVQAAGVLTLLTADKPIALPDEKIRLGKKYDAELVDMETFAVAEVCRRRQLPFLPLRIIFDAVDEPLMPGTAALQNSTGHGFLRLAGTVLQLVAKRPATVIDILKMYQDAIKAREKLTKQIAGELKRR